MPEPPLVFTYIQDQMMPEPPLHPTSGVEDPAQNPIICWLKSTFWMSEHITLNFQ